MFLWFRSPQPGAAQIPSGSSGFLKGILGAPPWPLPQEFMLDLMVKHPKYSRQILDLWAGISYGVLGSYLDSKKKYKLFGASHMFLFGIYGFELLISFLGCWALGFSYLSRKLFPPTRFLSSGLFPLMVLYLLLMW